MFGIETIVRIVSLTSSGYVRTRFASASTLDVHLIPERKPEPPRKYSVWKHLLGSSLILGGGLAACNGFVSGDYKMGLGSTAAAVLGIILESTFLRTGSNKKED